MTPLTPSEEDAVALIERAIEKIRSPERRERLLGELGDLKNLTQLRRLGLSVALAGITIEARFEEIHAALDAGKKVYWQTYTYPVDRDSKGGLWITAKVPGAAARTPLTARDATKCFVGEDQ